MVISSGASVVMSAPPITSPRTDPDHVDRAAAAPSRRTLKEGWIGQTARSSDEFSWLATAEPAATDLQRRASVDSEDLPDEERITAETSTRVESGPPLPAVNEDVLTADRLLYPPSVCLSVCLSMSVRTHSSLQQYVSLPQRVIHLQIGARLWGICTGRSNAELYRLVMDAGDPVPLMLNNSADICTL